MTPLSPSQKSVLRVRGTIGSVAPVIGALIIGSAFRNEAPVALPMLLAAALILAALLIFYVPPRRYRAWAYDMAEDELHIARGIWMRSHAIVPFGRVQHIDVSQGPVERRYGVGTLTLHTAGTSGAAIALPGLAIEDAERMRDEIRAKIRQDLA